MRSDSTTQRSVRVVEFIRHTQQHREQPQDHQDGERITSVSVSTFHTPHSHTPIISTFCVSLSAALTTTAKLLLRQ